MTAHTPQGNDRDGSVIPVTVYSDVICPWCFIGKRRLEAALDAPGMPHRVAITWRPFELNPDMPEEGMDRAEYRARKFGAGKARQLDEQMAETGFDVGIGFDFERMRRTPNTRLAHRLIWLAERQGIQAQNALVERLFTAYFTEGADIGSADVLLSLADEAGLQPIAPTALTNDMTLEAVLGLEDRGIEMGIRGVPFFLLIDKYAISGAQPPELWIDALPKIAAEMAGGPPIQ